MLLFYETINHNESQENSLLLWNPKFHSRVDKSSTLVPELDIQFLQDEFQY